MKKRTWLALLALVGIALAVYFEPTRCVCGWLYGEAFFDGRPTSWWRAELESWSVREEHVFRPWMHKRAIFAFHRNRTLIDKLKEIPDRLAGEPCLSDFEIWTDGPSLMQGSDDAVPVLRELLLDPSPQIRDLAEAGLKENQERKE